MKRILSIHKINILSQRTYLHFRNFSSKNSSMQQNLQDYLKKLKIKPKQQAKHPKSTPIQPKKQESSKQKQSPLIQFRKRVEGHGSQTSINNQSLISQPLQHKPISQINRSDSVPVSAYLSNSSNFKKQNELRINLQTSNLHKHIKKYQQVKQQRQQMTEEYNHQLQSQIGTPISQQDLFTQELQSHIKLAVKILNIKKDKYSYLRKQDIKKLEETQKFLKLCKLQLKIDPSQVKQYPGSSKGPLPSDNPQHYQQWWERNKPSVYRHPLYTKLLKLAYPQQSQYAKISFDDVNKESKKQNKSLNQRQQNDSNIIGKKFEVQTYTLAQTFLSDQYIGQNYINPLVTLAHRDDALFIDRLVAQQMNPQDLPPPPQTELDQRVEPHFFEWAEHKSVDEESMFPPGLSLDYQQSLKSYHIWGLYKMSELPDKDVKQVAMLNRILNMNDQLHYVNQVSVDAQTGHKVVQKVFKPIIISQFFKIMKKQKEYEYPSFITGGYYDLLPDKIRNSMMMKICTVGLEFKNTMKPRIQKEVMLNFVASCLLPLKEELHQPFIEMLLSSKKLMLNRERMDMVEDQLENMDWGTNQEDAFDQDYEKDEPQYFYPGGVIDEGFQRWRQKKLIEAKQLVWQTLMQDQKGNYDGMPEGWKPKCYSREAMKFLNDFDAEKKIDNTVDDIDNEDEAQQDNKYMQQDEQKNGQEALFSSQKHKYQDGKRGGRGLDPQLQQRERERLEKQKQKKRKLEEYNKRFVRGQVSSQEYQLEQRMIAEKQDLQFSVQQETQQFQGLDDHPMRQVRNPMRNIYDLCASPPIDYYDNDDGFWDDYIQEKRERNYKAMKIHWLPYISH